MLARLLPITLLIGLVCAASAQAATIKVPVPAEGQVSVAVAAVPKGKKVSLRVGQAPAAVAVSGSAKRGRLAIAVTRPRGTFGTGSVSVKVRGGKLKGVRRIGAALAGGKAPRAACKTLGTLLAKPLQTGGVSAGDLRAVGAAVGARVCGKPEPAGAAALLGRLGLGSAPPSGGLNPGGGGTKPPSPPSVPTNQCANGVDDDRDGQVDAASERKLRPDPGCMNANDPTEAGEVPVSAACAASSFVAIGEETSQLNVGINGGCGSFVEAAVYAAPSAFVCDIQASAGNWVCVIAHGQPFADTRNATAAEMADLQIGLNGAANCGVPATVVLYRPDFTVSELVEPIEGCTSGGGEVPPPAGCVAELSTFNGDPQFVGVAVSGCGAIKGVQFTPSATPSDCFVQVGNDPVAACDVSGSTAGATFAPTSEEVLLAMHTAVDPPCGPVTTAITLANGTVVKIRDNWC
jgi:hypothetical protein